jgi:outer membrane protein, multidrug efflux system
MKRHITRHTQTALAFAATALLVGCAGWGPKTPPAAIPSAPQAAQFVNAAATAAEPVQQFWRLFNDSTLNSLVSQALVSNTDLRVAVARVAEARAVAQGTDGAGKPTLGVGAGASRSRTGDGTGATNPGSSRTGNNFNAGLQAGWEPDLFGRISFEKTAAQAQLQTTQAQQRAVQVSVVAEVARTYFELRGQQEQLRVARAALQTQTEALKIVQARLDGGRGTALDTERAQALVASTAAAVPALDAAQMRSVWRLATLTGLAPNILPPALKETRKPCCSAVLT